MSKKPVKERVKEKVKAVKKRVKGKVKAAIALFGVMLFMVGCSTATPASRATTAGYEITVKVSMDERLRRLILLAPPRRRRPRPRLTSSPMSISITPRAAAFPTAALAVPVPQPELEARLGSSRSLPQL